jgi:hypothetical protein
MKRTGLVQCVTMQCAAVSDGGVTIRPDRTMNRTTPTRFSLVVVTECVQARRRCCYDIVAVGGVEMCMSSSRSSQQCALRGNVATVLLVFTDCS